jgi:nitrate reductase NapD
MSDGYHISSLLVRADPARREAVELEISRLKSAEIALSDPSGKLVVTLDTESEDEIVAAMSAMQHMEGVVSAALVFHQAEDGDPADRGGSQ